MNRVAWAHLPWSGGSLCGDTTKIEACPECIRRLSSLLLVHVQSLRRPHQSFCGRVIRRTDDPRPPLVAEVVAEAKIDVGPVLFWVTPEQARPLIRARGSAISATISPALPSSSVQGWEGWPLAPPICQGCETNLVRFDEANLRGARRVGESRSVPSPSDGGGNGASRRPSRGRP